MLAYLVRHGESEWNVLGLVQGQAAAPALTARGRDQARAAARLVRADAVRRGVHVTGVRTSDLVRAAQTAELVAGHLGCGVELDLRLREQHLGDLEGRPSAEAWAALSEHDWDDLDLPVAGGESPRRVRDRMAAALGEVHGVGHVDGHGALVLVSHGDAIRALLAHLDDAAGRAPRWADVPNGAVGRVAVDRVEWL